MGVPQIVLQHVEAEGTTTTTFRGVVYVRTVRPGSGVRVVAFDLRHVDVHRSRRAYTCASTTSAETPAGSWPVSNELRGIYSLANRRGDDAPACPPCPSAYVMAPRRLSLHLCCSCGFGRF